MAFTIFYSWQSDTDWQTNWKFIEKAANIAIDRINCDQSMGHTITLDHDTENTPGAPDIPNTVSSKIDKCDAFIADVSFVGSTDVRQNSSGKPKLIPNANVIMELGSAIKTISWDRIILIINTAYGPVDNLPSDFKHRRCLTYKLAPDQENKDEVLETLVKDLKDSIRLVIKSGPRHTTASDAPRDVAEFHSFLKDGSFLEMDASKGMLAMVLIPATPLHAHVDIFKNENMLQQHLRPLWCSGWNCSRTGSSFRSFFPAERNPTTAVEILSNGIIRAANRDLQTAGVNDPMDSQDSQGFEIIPLWDIETVLLDRVRSYLKLYKNLQVNGPWHVSASLLNLKPTIVQKRTKNYLVTDARAFYGKDIVPYPELIGKDIILDSVFSLTQILQPVFDFMWREFNFSCSPHYDNRGNWISA